MKIAIIGESKLALNLGNKFISRSIDVVYGVGNDFELKDKHISWKLANPSSSERFLTYKEAIDRADVLFLCCENDCYKEICQLIGESSLPAKCIVDCTNSSYPKGFNYNITMLKKHAKATKVFKAFSNLGLDYPSNDPLGLIKETYYCGEECEEKLMLKKLIAQAGFNPIDAGDFDSAMLLEAFYHLKIKISASHTQKSGFDFKLISL